jgi:putative DNA primase/helicase
MIATKNIFHACAKLKFILAMVKRDCAVLPVVEGGKKPAVKTGVKAASKNRDMIKKHFLANPNLNYGIATGAASNIFVVDLDKREGVEKFRRLRKINGQNAPTVTVRTPNGYHLYFRAPKHRVPNSVSRIGNQIDVRGDGGYVVGPGSRTPDGVYRFASGRSFADVEIAQAPAWLLKMIVQPLTPAIESAKPAEIPETDRERAMKYAETARRRELDRLQKAPLHQRNNTLNTCAFKLGQFLPYGLLNSATITGQLTEVAKKTGLSDQEIRATIDSGMRASQRHPRRLPFLNPSEQPPVRVAKAKKSTDTITEELCQLGENDADNAQRFAVRCGRKVIYTPGRGYLMFDGKRYRPDILHQCIELAKETARQIKREARYITDKRDQDRRIKFSQASLSQGSLERMLNLARSLLVVEDSKLDADPWLLNTETGTFIFAPDDWRSMTRATY